MLIRKDGIFRKIDSKDFGIYQSSGWEKVVPIEEPIMVEKPIVEKPMVEEPMVEEKPIVDELPKSKKKKK